MMIYAWQALGRLQSSLSTGELQMMNVYPKDCIAFDMSPSKLHDYCTRALMMQALPQVKRIRSAVETISLGRLRYQGWNIFRAIAIYAMNVNTLFEDRNSEVWEIRDRSANELKNCTIRLFDCMVLWPKNYKVPLPLNRLSAQQDRSKQVAGCTQGHTGQWMH
eukprot:IDg17081t1